jgi:hypothetical protein
LRLTLQGHLSLRKSRLESFCVLVVGVLLSRTVNLSHLAVITHPLVEVKSSVKSGTWQKGGSEPVQWVFGIRSVTFQTKRSNLLREWPHDWHRADNYFHRRSATVHDSFTSY